MVIVVLRKTDVKEYDQLISCYSRELGKSLVTAKSILRPKSKQSLHIDVLNLVEFSPIAGKSRIIMTGADSLETFQNIKKSIKKLSATFFVLEVFEKLIPYNEPDESLWNFLINYLYTLDKLDENSVKEFVISSSRDLSVILGYGGEKIEMLFWDIWNGGMYSLRFVKSQLQLRNSL